MEQNVLMKYMERRYKEKQDKPPKKEPGPVVTISRETGCPAKRIARILNEKIDRINEEQNREISWKRVSKEILHESAKELNLDPSKIQYVFNYEEKGVWDEVFSSFSTRYYKSDRRIRRTIAEVIKGIANQGNVIIIGRGGVAITKDIPKSLHINLVAPLEWRAIQVYRKTGKELKEAEEYCKDIDQKRKKLRESFQGKHTDYTWFDAYFNCMTLKDEEIADSIIQLMKFKGLI